MEYQRGGEMIKDFYRQIDELHKLVLGIFLKAGIKHIVKAWQVTDETITIETRLYIE